MRARSSSIAVFVLAACAFLILIGLGTWQLQRLAWKEEIVARVTERTAAAPVPLPEPAA